MAMSHITAPAAPAHPVHPAMAASHAGQQAVAMIDETIDWVGDNLFRIAVAGGLGVLLVLVLLALRKFGERLAGEHDAIVTLHSIIGRVAHRTGTWFLVLLAIRVVAQFADTPPALDKAVGFFFTIGVTFQVAVWLREIILGFVEYRAGLSDHDHSALGSALGIIRLLVTLTLFSLATVLVLDNLGVNVTGLIAGLGIGGIAIGLAAQGIFKDLFAALAIIFDRPFRKGDTVKWNGVSGTVEAIGLKTTRIRATTGEQVIVGNANLLEKEMFNLARLERRRMILAIGVVYNVPEDIADRIPDLLREITQTVAKCKVVRVGMIGFGDSSLDFELQFDVLSKVYDEVFEARSKVCLAILRRFNALGIEFAFPTRVTMTAGPDGKAMMPYPDVQLLAHPHGDHADAETAQEAAP